MLEVPWLQGQSLRGNNTTDADRAEQKGEIQGQINKTQFWKKRPEKRVQGETRQGSLGKFPKQEKGSSAFFVLDSYSLFGGWGCRELNWAVKALR